MEREVGPGPAARGAQFGRFIIPSASGEADPTGTTEGIPDGLTLAWVSGGVAKISRYYASLGAWKTWTPT